MRKSGLIGVSKGQLLGLREARYRSVWKVSSWAETADFDFLVDKTAIEMIVRSIPPIDISDGISEKKAAPKIMAATGSPELSMVTIPGSMNADAVVMKI